MKRVNPALAVVAAVFVGARMLGPGQEVGQAYRISDGVSRSHVEYHQLTLARGQEKVLADLVGPGKVTYFYITDDTQVHWYAGLVLRVFWDEEAEPSVEAPLADFFGAVGGKTIDYQSAPMQINHGCYMCYLPMPFSRRARFILANDGERDYAQSVAYGIDYEQDKRYASEQSRLHCAWKRSNPVKQGLHTVLEARGRGQYVGNFLQVHTRFAGWWGEGDTIFDLDGQRITHSPGTEDEYGSCWGFEHTYSYLYSGYLQMERGDHRMYRWYLANPVRFQKSLKVELQNQHQNGRPTTTDADDYTSVAFWYQERPHQRPGLAPFAERVAPAEAVKSGVRAAAAE
ncbi:MAG: glycoside hydrolase family 172 protein [Verrucomicrobiota bacterium]|jgi:hypothetical protein